MLKKITSAVTISALAALSLVSIASASLGDSFDITGTGHANKVAGAEYANFTIANGDPNEEGTTDQARVQSSPVDDDQDNDRTTRNGEKLNIGASDPAEQ